MRRKGKHTSDLWRLVQGVVLLTTEAHCTRPSLQALSCLCLSLLRFSFALKASFVALSFPDFPRDFESGIFRFSRGIAAAGVVELSGSFMADNFWLVARFVSLLYSIIHTVQQVSILITLD